MSLQLDWEPGLDGDGAEITSDQLALLEDGGTIPTDCPFCDWGVLCNQNTRYDRLGPYLEEVDTPCGNCTDGVFELTAEHIDEDRVFVPRPEKEYRT